jgi:hypothetical protein
MPILHDIRDHDYYGPLLKREREQGRLEILLDQIVKRFGSVPPDVRKRLAGLEPKQLRAACLRVLDAKTIEDGFPARARAR